MEGRKCSQESKLETVRLVRERGVAVAQADRQSAWQAILVLE